MNSIHSYLDNIDVSICSSLGSNIDNWYETHIIQANCNDVGCNTESKPLFVLDNNETHHVSILQFCTPTSILIYRNFTTTQLPLCLIQFLENPNINKYCIDSTQYKNALCNLNTSINGLVDLQLAVDKDKRINVATLAKDLLNLDMNKSNSIQAGDWDKEKLTIKQIEYAASNVVICLALAEQLNFVTPKLLRTIPLNVTQPKGDKPTAIISFLICCIKFRKKELNVNDVDGFIPLISVINLIEY